MRALCVLTTAPLLAAVLLAAAPALAADGHMAGHGALTATATATATADAVAGTGTVDAVDAAKRTVTISHRPIQALGWPSMTMSFAVAAGVDLAAVKPGTAIDFTLRRGADGIYMVGTLAGR
ncbi:copper-binding protein [Azospirillum sp. ST 5-10]|uniref:copper-binding protein n=1 Tax=unclassified Azospirillum TaxID=2630922 RepID=UPI003F4A7A92